MIVDLLNLKIGWNNFYVILNIFLITEVFSAVGLFNSISLFRSRICMQKEYNKGLEPCSSLNVFPLSPKTGVQQKFG